MHHLTDGQPASGHPIDNEKATKPLGKIRHVALDMDGTIYNGTSLFGTTIPFLSLLDHLGIGHTFLTNNPSKSSEEYLAHLSEMGIQVTADQLYTSTLATIDFLKIKWPQVRRLFVLGTPGLGDRKSTRLNSSHLGISYA